MSYSDLDGNSSIGSGEVMNRSMYYAFGMEIQGDWLVTDPAKNKYLYNGKEIHDWDGLNWQDYGARWYMPEIGRWNSVEPHASSYPSLSGYSAFANNPINVIDPDGRDIIVLRNSDGANGTGHGAILVGNNRNGWTYISKDGYTGSAFGSTSKFVVQKFNTIEDFRNSPHNFVLADGTHSTSEGKEAISFNFKLDGDGNKVQRYDQALYFGTTQADGSSTDAQTISSATASAKSDYCLTTADCSDVISAGLNVSKDNNGKQIKNGETGFTGSPIYDLWTERPNTKYNKIESRNSSDVKYDAGVKPDDKTLKPGETGKK